MRDVICGIRFVEVAPVVVREDRILSPLREHAAVVVQQLGPRVGGEHLQSAAIALPELGLERMIARVPERSPNVLDGVELRVWTKKQPCSGGRLTDRTGGGRDPEKG